MTPLEKQLADALRKCEAYANAEFQEMADKDAMRASDEAREALAAYDAQPQRPPITHKPGFGLGRWPQQDAGQHTHAAVHFIREDGSLATYDAPEDTERAPAETWRATPAPNPARMSVWEGRRYIAEPLTDDARRIVACVNACAGIPTEHLEGI